MRKGMYPEVRRLGITCMIELSDDDCGQKHVRALCGASECESLTAPGALGREGSTVDYTGEFLCGAYTPSGPLSPSRGMASGTFECCKRV